MAGLIDVRLIVIGPDNALRRLEDSTWQRSLRAKYVELYEFSQGRRVWWFQVESVSAKGLQRLSAEHIRITFLVDFEDQSDRVKGLLKACGGKVDRCEFTY
jgi:hypothetical protein